MKRGEKMNEEQIREEYQKQLEKEMEEKVGRIRCNNCETIFESEDDLQTLQEDNEFFKGCPKCKTDKYLMHPFNERGQKK